MVDDLEHSLELLPEAVSIVIRGIPRHEFVTNSSYQNRPTGHHDTDTTILAPMTIVYLLAALNSQSNNEVLVIDTGVDYTATTLAKTVGDAYVHVVDITCSLVYEVHENPQRAGYDDILMDCCDDTEGLADYVPFDHTLVEASAVRPPTRLPAQLADDGWLIMPKGVGGQTLVIIKDDEAAELSGPLLLKPLFVDSGQTGSIVRDWIRREGSGYESRGWHAGHGWEQDWVD